MAKARPFLVPPVLDVGCGRCVAFEPALMPYVGMDRNREWVTVPMKNGIPVLAGSAFDLPFRDGAFQTVLLMAVIEHLHEPESCLREVNRVLRPGGRVVVTTPTPAGDRIHHLLARFGLTSKHAADEHASIFEASSLTQLMRQAGFIVELHRHFLLGGNQVCVGRRPPEDTSLTDAGAPKIAARSGTHP